MHHSLLWPKLHLLFCDKLQAIEPIIIDQLVISRYLFLTYQSSCLKCMKGNARRLWAVTSFIINNSLSYLVFYNPNADGRYLQDLWRLICFQQHPPTETLGFFQKKRACSLLFGKPEQSNEALQLFRHCRVWLDYSDRLPEIDPYQSPAPRCICALSASVYNDTDGFQIRCWDPAGYEWTIPSGNSLHSIDISVVAWVGPCCSIDEICRRRKRSVPIAVTISTLAFFRFWGKHERFYEMQSILIFSLN